MVLIDIVTRLRQQQEGMLRKGEFAFVNRHDILQLLTIVDTLRAERDEARQFVCNREYLMTGMTTTPQEIAKERGWDCFSQEDSK
jgi:uncharacterized protein Yka (UPF0111/DUF47 family)